MRACPVDSPRPLNLTALAAAATLASATLTFAPISPAHAAADTVGGGGYTNASAQVSGGACTVPDYQETNGAMFPWATDGHATAAIADSGVDVSAESTLSGSADLVDGLLQGITLGFDLVATVTSNQVEDPNNPGAGYCSGTADARAQADITFTTHRPRIVALSLSGGDASLALTDASDMQLLVVDTYTATDPVSQGSITVPAGSYTLVARSSPVITTVTPTGSGEQLTDTTTGTYDFSMALSDPGLAMSDPSGTGKAYVAFPAARQCLTHRLVLGLKKAAQIKKITVDASASTKTVSSPKATTKVTLTGLPDGDPITAFATIKLKSGGTVTARRSYESCT